MKRPIALLLSCLLFPAAARADVKMPSIFGDHMILQQDAPLPVWGIADVDEKVTVSVGPNSATTTSGTDGKWHVTLAPLAGTSMPLIMSVAGKNTLTFKDVLVGEVWFASGQSNMGLSLKQVKNAAEIPEANDPQLRFFQVSGARGLEPSNQLSVGSWSLATPATAGRYSAVAYYFGNALRTKLDRPVAIVQGFAGGTLAEAWTPIDAIRKNLSLKNYADSYDKVKAAFLQMNAGYPAKMDTWHKDHNQWTSEVGTAYNLLVAAWQAEADKARAAGTTPPPKPQPSRPAPVPPIVPWGGDATPSVLYNGSVAPVVPYAIRGVIWYQGEANFASWAKYHEVLTALITGWRDHWGQGDFPFLIVQLPRYLGGQNWPQLREAQARALALPNTAMATVIDVGDPNNLHPVDKLDVGKRLALVARHWAYGEKDLVWTGPIYDAMKIEGNSIRIGFTQTGSGLTIGSSPWVPPGSTPIPTTSLLGFAIADGKKNWFPSEAKIDGNTVVVSSGKVSNPTAVRYAWQPSPECNLYNKEGLPAAPFRTDNAQDIAVSTPALPSAAKAASVDTPTEPTGQQYKMERNLVYAQPGGHRLCLDLYLPSTGTGPFPLIVGIHGGGWGAARSVWFTPGLLPWRFLTGNYAFANVDYRVIPATFPAQIEDCKAAIRWLRANAARYNIDSDHIGIWGPSAGGHLVALLGTTGDVKEFDVGENLDVSSRVQAVCDFCGPTDLLEASQRPDQEKWKTLIQLEGRLLGGAPLDFPDKARAASPTTYVSQNAPPFLIVHGAMDTTVPPEESQMLYDALIKAGAKAQLYFYPKGGHGGWCEKPEIIAMVQAFFDQYLTKAKPAGQ